MWTLRTLHVCSMGLNLKINGSVVVQGHRWSAQSAGSQGLVSMLSSYP